MKIVGHIPGREILKGTEALRSVIDLMIGAELQLSQEVLDEFTLKEFGKLKRLIGRRPVTVHAPFLDLNPGALDKYVLKATRDRFFETVVASKVLDAEVIVFHTGYHPQKVKPFYDRWLSRALSTFEEVLKIWSGRIALENVFDETPENLRNFLDKLPERAGVCLDVGHLNLFSKVPISEWFEVLGERIYELHVHDNTGESDDHLPIGSGNVDFNEVLRGISKLKTEYILNLENKSVEGIRESLETLRRNPLWREISSSTQTKS